MSSELSNLSPVELAKLVEHEIGYFAHIASVERTEFATCLIAPELAGVRDANRALQIRFDPQRPVGSANELVRFFRVRGLPATADLDRAGRDEGGGALLSRAGLRPIADRRLLMRLAEPTGAFTSALGVEARRMDPAESSELAAWIEVQASLETYPEAAAAWRLVAQREAAVPESALYLASWNGAPAGGCLVYVKDGWARIESVATVPEFRGRGVATALLAAALKDSRLPACAAVYLFTDQDSQAARIYTRLGFRPWAVNILRRYIEAS